MVMGRSVEVAAKGGFPFRKAPPCVFRQQPYQFLPNTYNQQNNKIQTQSYRFTVVILPGSYRAFAAGQPTFSRIPKQKFEKALTRLK